MRTRRVPTGMWLWRRHPGAVIGGIYLMVLVTLAVFAPLLPLPDPNEQNLSNRLESILSSGYLLGSDSFGRDILSRLIWGGRYSLATAIVPTVIAAAVGLLLGTVAGLHERGIGAIVMRGMDVLFAFPLAVLAVALAGSLGAGLRNLILVIIVVLVPYMTRTVFAEVRGVRHSEFVMSARVSGSRDMHVVMEELLPHVVSPLLVMASISAGAMIWVSAGLSFLGLGPPPPAADWGRMIAENAQVLATAPHASTIPGVAILTVGWAFNLMGDALRDSLDPAQRRMLREEHVEFIG